MIRSGRFFLLICILIAGAAGALGSAFFNSSMLKIKHFTIEADEDSLRTQPLINLLDKYHGRYFFQVSKSMLRDDISDFKQVERVTINRTGINGFTIKIKLRCPLLMVTNGLTRICLGPGAIPFPYWSEHGELPIFTVSEEITSSHLLEPDSALKDFYLFILHIVSQSLDSLYQFSTMVDLNEYEILLADRQNHRLLRLPRNRFRDPASSLIDLHNWLNTENISTQNQELDFRFQNMVIIKSLKGARNNVS